MSSSVIVDATRWRTSICKYLRRSTAQHTHSSTHVAKSISRATKSPDLTKAERSTSKVVSVHSTATPQIISSGESNELVRIQKKTDSQKGVLKSDSPIIPSPPSSPPPSKGLTMGPNLSTTPKI